MISRKQKHSTPINPRRVSPNDAEQTNSLHINFTARNSILGFPPTPLSYGSPCRKVCTYFMFPPIPATHPHDTSIATTLVKYSDILLVGKAFDFTSGISTSTAELTGQVFVSRTVTANMSPNTQSSCMTSKSCTSLECH